MTDLSQPASALLCKHRLNVDAFHKLEEAGVLDRNARVVLFEGELIDMAPIGNFHASVVDQLLLTLARVSDDLIVRVQNPIRFSESTELQPDLALLKASPNFYRYDAPTPGDVLLLIEVADSSLKADRELMIPFYARHGIPEVWLVSIPEELVEIHTAPTVEGYGQTRRCRVDEFLTTSHLPGLSIPVRDLF